MSDREQTPGNSGDEPDSDVRLPDEAREAALIRKVLRVQELHREGGIDPELDVDDAPEPSGSDRPARPAQPPD
jgi:hypothetical protein